MEHTALDPGLLSVKSVQSVVQEFARAAQILNVSNVNIIIALGMAKEGFDWIWCEHALTVTHLA